MSAQGASAFPIFNAQRLGRPIRTRTGISGFGNLCPVRLDDEPVWNGRRASNPNSRFRKPALCPIELRPFVIGVAGGNRILVDGSTDRRLTTRPRPHLVPGARVERACPAFQTGASTATAFPANLVEEEGVEPPSAGCRPAVLPLNDSPKSRRSASHARLCRRFVELGCGLAS